MPVFLEKVILPVLVTAGAAILIVNPMKFDWESRISLFVGLLAIGYFVSHQLHLRNEAIRTGTAPSVSVTNAVPKPTHISGAASTIGDGSPANTGDGNTFTHNGDIEIETAKPKQK